MTVTMKYFEIKSLFVMFLLNPDFSNYEGHLGDVKTELVKYNLNNNSALKQP